MKNLNLKDIANKLEKFFKIDLKEENLPSWKDIKFISLFYNYTYKKLFEEIKPLFRGYKLPNNFLVLPSVEGPDWVVNIKDFFELNKDKFSNVKEAADKVFQTLNGNISNFTLLQSVKLQGIFVNLYVSKDYIKSVFSEFDNFENRGFDNLYNGEKIVVDYSSPNIAKQMTVGHLRSTIIGQVLSNILQFRGADVLRWNYLGDWGTPFGKLIYVFLRLYYYDKFDKNDQIENFIKEVGAGEKLLENLKKDPIFILGKLYAFFKDLPDEDKEEKARYYFKLLSQGDENIKKIWLIFRYLSLKEFGQVYNLLNIKFDTTLGEAFAEKYTVKVIEDLEKKGYLTESEGALVVFFKKNGKDYVPLTKQEFESLSESEKKDLEVLLIKKQDGTTLYSTRDLATIYIRSKLLGAKKIFYVVGKEQSLHFKLVFSLVDKLGYTKKENLYHIPFGLLLVDGKKMSSRKGNIFRLVDLIELVEREILNQYGDRINSDTAQKLAISAIIINDLKNDPIKDINFDIKKMIQINGDTGVYLQYGFVRLKNLIKKLKDSLQDLSDLKFGSINVNLLDESELNLVKKISIFPIVLNNVLKEYKPNLLVNYFFDLVKDFNSWYSNSPKILDLSQEMKINKYLFLKILEKVFEEIFSLLNLPAVDKM